MADITASNFSISNSGDIRSVAGTSTHTILELHKWLQDLADNAAPSGDDNVSILGLNPSELAGKRNSARPMAITLLNGYNLDDSTAQRFYFGSVEQQSGAVLYTGLKSIGNIVAASPIYIVQNAAKVTKFWNDGHIQILLKAKSGGTLIDNGDVTVFSRKFGQSYSHADVNLAAGGEQPAAMSTALDTNISLSAAAAQAIWNTITLTIGDTNQDLGNGNGSKLYKGKITLNGTTTLAQAYQALMWACSESSSATINSVPGWRYRKLNAAYDENVGAPFGSFAGGKFFVAQGWWIEGVMSADSKNYELKAHDGSQQIPPNSVSVQIGGVVSGDYVLCARDNGSGDILTNEYTITASAGASSVTVSGLKADTPATGVIRIDGDRYTYTGINTGTGAVSGLTPTITTGGYSAAPAFIPLIDDLATGTTISSAQMQFSANFNCRFRVRNGGVSSPIVPFESTLSVTSTGGSGTAVRNADQ